MAKTHTGSFPIGFRRGWGAWQRDLPQLLAFARANDFEFLDFGPVPPDELRQVRSAGVRVGSVDLKDWKLLLSPDAGRRNAAADANAEYVRAIAAEGVRTFLAAAVPEDPARPRAENFAYAVEGYGRLLAAVAPLGVKVVLEGWPGAAPHYATLACTPADCRALFAAVGSDALGVNYDPSHLVRTGIDPVRFAREFAGRIHHAHAKDADLPEEARYQHGDLQAATFDRPHEFGGHHWRYTIPGRGRTPWGDVLTALSESGYRGPLSIELEDEQFNGSADGEQRRPARLARLPGKRLTRAEAVTCRTGWCARVLGASPLLIVKKVKRRTCAVPTPELSAPQGGRCPLVQPARGFKNPPHS